MATVGIDFFRVNRSGAVRRLLLTAGGLVSAGATTIGAHLVSNFGEGAGRAIALLGGLITVAGLILGFGSMAMFLFENVYILIEKEGVLFHENGKETTLPWPDLEEAALEGKTGFVVFRRREGTPLRWFAGDAAMELHERIQDAKRKALHGLFKANT